MQVEFVFVPHQAEQVLILAPKNDMLGRSDMVLAIEISRICAGMWFHNERLWFCPREFTTLQGYTMDYQP